MFRFTPVLLAMTLVSCRSLPSSHVSHEIGMPKSELTPLLWTAVSDHEYAEKIQYDHMKEYKLKAPGIAPAKHPARQRLQVHIDRIDQRLRQLYPDQLQGIPTPRAQLILSKDVNAEVHRASVCIKKNLSMAGPSGEGSDRFWEFDSYSGQFIADPDPNNPVICAEREFSDAELKKILAWEFKGKCSASSSGQNITLPEACAALFPVPPKNSSAETLAIMLMPDSVTFLAGLLINFNEDELIFWIAHELGHYYRAHSIVPRGDLTIYYNLGSKNATKKPSQNPKLSEFAGRMEGLRDLMGEKGLTGLNSPQKKEWQALNAEAFQKKIGQYTAEQEADEIALEWIIEDGFEVELSTRSMLKYLKVDGTLGTRNPREDKAWDYDRCKAAFDKGWKDEEDLPVFVPVGDFQDSHHSNCYRAFNLYRETLVHDYAKSQRAAAKPKLLPDSAWKTLQGNLAEEVRKLVR